MEDSSTFDPIALSDTEFAISNVSLSDTNSSGFVSPTAESYSISPMDSPRTLIHAESVERKAHVTTIQEYSRLVINCMKKGKKMNTTEVARCILGMVRPRPSSLTVNVRRRVGDALSVLTAINYVKKTSSGYVWIHNENAVPDEYDRMKCEVDSLKMKLAEKKAKLEALIALTRQRQKEKQQATNIQPKGGHDISSDTDAIHEESETSYNSISIPEFSYSDVVYDLNVQEMDSPTDYVSPYPFFEDILCIN